MRLALVLIIWACANPIFAQSFPIYEPQVRFAVIDQAELFEQSKLGQQMRQALVDKRNLLDAESAELASALEQEEQDLAQKRSEMSDDDFAVIAQAFDQRVRSIRQDQINKDLELAREGNSLQATFFDLVDPILNEIIASENITTLLKSDAILFSTDIFDITNLAIQRIDRANITP